MEQVAKRLLLWAPKRPVLPQTSLEISIDHFVNTKARGSAEAAAKVDDFFDKIRSMKRD